METQQSAPNSSAQGGGTFHSRGAQDVWIVQTSVHVSLAIVKTPERGLVGICKKIHTRERESPIHVVASRPVCFAGAKLTKSFGQYRRSSYAGKVEHHSRLSQSPYRGLA